MRPCNPNKPRKPILCTSMRTAAQQRVRCDPWPEARACTLHGLHRREAGLPSGLAGTRRRPITGGSGCATPPPQPATLQPTAPSWPACYLRPELPPTRVVRHNTCPPHPAPTRAHRIAPLPQGLCGRPLRVLYASQTPSQTCRNVHVSSSHTHTGARWTCPRPWSSAGPCGMIASGYRSGCRGSSPSRWVHDEVCTDRLELCCRRDEMLVVPMHSSARALCPVRTKKGVGRVGRARVEGQKAPRASWMPSVQGLPAA